MRFITKEESIKWCKDNGITISNDNSPEIKKSNLEMITFPFPEPLKFVLLSREFSKALFRGEECLLWVTGWSVWPSSENLPLYYQLRKSYSDFNLLIEKPGHLFSTHESEDFAHFLHLGLLFAWDCYLLSDKDESRILTTNDEMIDLLGYSTYHYFDLRRSSGVKRRN